MQKRTSDLVEQFIGGATKGGVTNGNASNSLWMERSGVSNILSNPAALAAGGVAGGLAGLLLGGKKPEKLAKNALKYGGVAVAGGLAWKAWRDWNDNKQPSPAEGKADIRAPEGTVFAPVDHDEAANQGKLLVRAMIAAAKADGRIDENERTRILDFVAQQGIADQDQTWLRAELQNPIDVQGIVREATCPEIAAEIYIASLLAVDPDGRAEQGYLQLLGAQLDLDPDLIDHLHAQAEWRVGGSQD